MRLTVPASGFKTDTIRINPNRLRDPHAATLSQPFPEKFLTMCRLYSRYRVNAVKIFISYQGLTNNENAKFFSCVYTSTSSDGISDPFPAASVASRDRRDAFLQHSNIRKRMIASSGTTGGRKDNIHNVGMFSLSRIEQIRPTHMDDVDYAGAVNINGSTAGDPNVLPNIWISGVSPNYTGFPGADTYDVNVTAVFYCEWFDKREALADAQGETDP